ncbi:hypothetical protein WJX84_008911 [Apatococcus fuscideae]|uniref:Uncharacterized protein n=1 Tax=Apatococcus fuscideae TaxID=2026836 RepID=A0AAW1S4U7_9CHLO
MSSALSTPEYLRPGMTFQPHYTDLQLDRAAILRKETGKLQEFISSPKAKTVIMHGGKCLVRPAETEPQQPEISLPIVADHQTAVQWEPVYMAPSSLAEILDERYQQLFLGVDPDGSPVFAAVVEKADEAAASAQQHGSCKVSFLQR